MSTKIQIGITVVFCRVINALLKRVVSFISVCTFYVSCGRVILVLLTLTLTTFLAVARVNEQVERIVVEVKLRTISFRHRAPGLQTAVVMTGLIVVTAIESGLCTVVGRHYIRKQFGGNLLLGLIAVLIAVIQVLPLGLRHLRVFEDEVVIAQLHGLGADVGHRGATAMIRGESLRHRSARIVVVLYPAFNDGDLLRHDVCCLKFGLSRSFRLVGNGLVSVFNVLGDKVANGVGLLAEHLSSCCNLQSVGRTVLIIGLLDRSQPCIFGCIDLVRVRSALRGVPRIPLAGIVHLVGEQIACVVAGVVRLAEDVILTGRILVAIENHIAFSVSVGVRAIALILCVGHHKRARLVQRAAVDAHRDTVGIGLLYEQLLLCIGQQVPVPIVDGIVRIVGLVVDDHLLAALQLHAGCRIVGIAVGLHIKQLHLTM